ncbi:hypothetical protein Rxycam_00787 [Rubrobacter xylanophilus DSM 9941]|nr:hypothetical protein Rxycam_00787 [Rubrobacter xylanophilus DSM 9941]
MRGEEDLEALRGALRRLKPRGEGYARLPVREAFGWEEVLGGLEGRVHLVAFRSVRREDADEELLERLDRLAYEEASTAPGFLHYFRGPLSPGRECLSFCLWESAEHARTAASGVLHELAAGAASRMYECYVLERYEVVFGEAGLSFRLTS